MAVKITEEEAIDTSAISPERYRSFLRKAIDGFSPEIHCGEFKHWLNLHNGKTLKEAMASYRLSTPAKSMEDRMAEERFHILSEADKGFVLAFSREIKALGYGHGGRVGWGACWGRYMIIYSKDGAKSKRVAARIFIRDNGIVLRLFFNDVEKHAAYIESAPAHIKGVFTNSRGDCACKPRKEGCRMRKTYRIGGRSFEKCSGAVFEFHNPSTEKLPDYIGLLKEFHKGKAWAKDA